MKKFRRALLLFTAMAMLLELTACGEKLTNRLQSLGDSAGEIQNQEQTEEIPERLQYIRLKVAYAQFFFPISKSEMTVYFDDQELGTLGKWSEGTYYLATAEGAHTVKVKLENGKTSKQTIDVGADENGLLYSAYSLQYKKNKLSMPDDYTTPSHAEETTAYIPYQVEKGLNAYDTTVAELMEIRDDTHGLRICDYLWSFFKNPSWRHEAESDQIIFTGIAMENGKEVTVEIIMTPKAAGDDALQMSVDGQNLTLEQFGTFLNAAISNFEKRVSNQTNGFETLEERDNIPQELVY